jgi:hypothetical protein
MAERKPASLLDFAIAASIAVVPVLLGVVLLVAVIRPADVEASGRSPQERYLSARLVAALKTFEPAVLRRSAISARIPDGAGVLAALPARQREWRGASPWRAWLAETGLARKPPPPPAAQDAAALAGRRAARQQPSIRQVSMRSASTRALARRRRGAGKAIENPRQRIRCLRCADRRCAGALGERRSMLEPRLRGPAGRARSLAAERRC